MFRPFIFVSYSHEDSMWFQKGSLMARLIPSLEKQASAEVWFDKRRIGGADIWREEIDNAIDRTDIAILLVSQYFLNSDFIMKVELPRLVKRAAEKQLVIFPILVGYCGWESIDALSRPQMMPGEPTPLVEYLEPLARWERVQYEILQALLRQIEKLRKERKEPAPPLREVVKAKIDNVNVPQAKPETTAPPPPVKPGSVSMATPVIAPLEASIESQQKPAMPPAPTRSGVASGIRPLRTVDLAGGPVAQAPQAIANEPDAHAEDGQASLNSKLFLFATNAIQFAVGVKDSKLLSFAYAAGTTVQYSRKGMDGGSHWYQLQGAGGKGIWLQGYSANHIDTNDTRYSSKFPKQDRWAILWIYGPIGVGFTALPDELELSIMCWEE
jgi:hypothetical protein